MGRLLTTQVSQLGARLACKNSSSFSVFLKLEVSVIFLFLNVYFLQMAEKNACLFLVQFSVQTPAWQLSGATTVFEPESILGLTPWKSVIF